jgi:hypothetical protein
MTKSKLLFFVIFCVLLAVWTCYLVFRISSS